MTFDPNDYTNPHYEAEANLAHAEGVSTDCLGGQCGNCWDDECACPCCGHPGPSTKPTATTR
jgi:hypothetical protein